MIIWILISIKNINFSKMSMMTSYLNNQTIYLNSNPSTNQENEFFVWLVSAEDAMMYHIRDLPKHYQWICITLIWLMVSIIFCFRSLLYSHLYQKYRKKEFNAINVLTFVEAILWRQITVTALAVFYTVMVVSDAQPEEITGPWFCYPITLLYRFVIFYTPLGQLGIAIYRILLLKHERIAKYAIGLDNMMYIILASGIVFAAVCTFLISITDYESLFTKTCTIIQPERRQVLDMLERYELSQGNPSIYAYWRDVRILLATCMLMTTISQIIIYINFFQYLYRHDNKETLRRLLDPNVIKLRNRTNAITFLGQFCSFVFELSFNVLIHLAVWMGDKENRLVGITVIVGCITSTGGSIIEVLTSPSLKKKIILDEINSVKITNWRNRRNTIIARVNYFVLHLSVDSAFG